MVDAADLKFFSGDAPRDDFTPVGTTSDTDREDALGALGTGFNPDGSSTTLEDAFGPGFFWQDAVVDQILSDIKALANSTDMDLNYVTGWFNGQKLNLVNYLDQNWLDVLDPNTPQGVQGLFQAARAWVSTKVPGFGEAVANIPAGGGGGSGSRRPNIRAQFDVNEMTRAVQNLSQALILDEFPGAKALAKSYIDAVVANPTQNLDFETYVRGKILGTARAKMIYKNKPDSLTHEQFLQPYVQAFQQVAGPGFGDQLANTAIGAARLSADPSAYMARLQRTSQVQSSAPFLSKLGNRMTNFAQVIR